METSTTSQDRGHVFAARQPARIRERVIARAGRSGDDSGAVLVLALIFLVSVSLIVGSLATWTSDSLTNTANFQNAEAAHNALNSATQVAIQNIRYTPLVGAGQTLNASPPSYCFGSGPTSYLSTLDNDAGVYVWCSTLFNPGSAQTRRVTISACITPSNSASLTPTQMASQCAGDPGLQTTVTFDDYPSTLSTPNPGNCTPPNCGYGMTINSSSESTSLPTVTSVVTSSGGSTSGPVTGNFQLNVTGTGFVTSTIVDFVAITPTANLIVPATGVTVNSSTSITATAPPMTTATSYYVTVTTPAGTSADGPQFAFGAVVPTVTSIATSTGTATGSAAGGTSLTITGTGFLSPVAGDTTAVNFVDTASTSTIVAAASVSVISSTSITVTTPAVTSTTLTYYVIVTTTPTGNSSAAGPVFTFTPLTPVVASINPTPAASGTTVTLTGIGFVSTQTTVTLVNTTNTNTTLTISGAGVTVTSSTVLTAVLPTGTHGQTYYVVVSTTSGGPSSTNGDGYQGAPIFTYS